MPLMVDGKLIMVETVVVSNCLNHIADKGYDFHSR